MVSPSHRPARSHGPYIPYILTTGSSGRSNSNEPTYSNSNHFSQIQRAELVKEAQDKCPHPTTGTGNRKH